MRADKSPRPITTATDHLCAAFGVDRMKTKGKRIGRAESRRAVKAGRKRVSSRARPPRKPRKRHVMPDETTASSSPSQNLANIQHFVVLMLENRSFDHLFGALPGVAGLARTEFNYDDPTTAQSAQKRIVTPADKLDKPFGMPFDPPHEFPDVQFQLYGPKVGQENQPNPPVDPAPMSGFVFQALATGPHLYAEDAARVMSFFPPKMIPVLATLASEFAVINTWYSSLPGPTWPNRFFVHAATSGGLNYSPTDLQIIAGFTFKGGTIYDRLGAKGWRIYHDGLPQCIGIADLRWNYLRQTTDPFGSNFRPMSSLVADLAAGDLPAFTFIEPRYDTGNSYIGGNSMHPQNDIREGEKLVKQVYETLRASQFWNSTMLIITFDEHGGFYDHVSPPPTVPTGDDHRYADSDYPFNYDRLGVRVPALVISPFTQKGTVIGSPGDGRPYDHSSIAATVLRKFNLPGLTARDAQAPTVDTAVNLAVARTDTPSKLPEPAAEIPSPAGAAQPLTAGLRDYAPLSDNQRTFLALALACDLELTGVSQQAALREQYANITTQKQATDYINGVTQKITPAQKS
jgi:phospholipase C